MVHKYPRFNYIFKQGYIGTVNELNPHGVQKGTKFKVVQACNSDFSLYPIEVRFFGIEHKELNNSGPLLNWQCIELHNTDLTTLQVLYGPKDLQENK